MEGRAAKSNIGHSHCLTSSLRFALSGSFLSAHCGQPLIREIKGVAGLIDKAEQMLDWAKSIEISRGTPRVQSRRDDREIAPVWADVCSVFC